MFQKFRGWWGTQGRVPRSSMRCGVINGPVFFPLQEHSKFQETNQKPRMINCAVYNESCCVCLWIPLLCRSGAPGAEKHLAMRSLLNFLLTQSRKGEEGFSLQVNSKGNQSWWEKMIRWDENKRINQAAVIALAFFSPFLDLCSISEKQNTVRKSQLQSYVSPPLIQLTWQSPYHSP